MPTGQQEPQLTRDQIIALIKEQVKDYAEVGGREISQLDGDQSMRTALAQASESYNKIISGMAYDNQTGRLSFLFNDRSSLNAGTLPVVPQNIITATSLGEALALLRTAPAGGNENDVLAVGANNMLVWLPLADAKALQVGIALGANLLPSSITAPISQEITLPVSSHERLFVIKYAYGVSTFYNHSSGFAIIPGDGSTVTRGPLSMSIGNDRVTIAGQGVVSEIRQFTGQGPDGDKGPRR